MKPLLTRVWMIVALISILAMSPANAVTLGDLINNNGTLTSGDKVFSNFSYTSASGGLPLPATIAVTPVIRNGNPGLEFQAAWNNPTSGTTLDGLIEYVVTAPSPIIIDNELFGNPSVLNGSGNTSLSGAVSVVETVLNSNNQVVATYSIQDSAVYTPGSGTAHTIVGDSHVYFPPYMTLTIKKDMMFRNSGLEPTLSFVDQTFSQVPEPGTLSMLFGSGIWGGILLLKRKLSLRQG